MQSDDKPTLITFGKYSHDSQWEVNLDSILNEEITPESSRNASDMLMHYLIEPQKDGDTITNLQSPNFHVQSLASNFSLPSTNAIFSPSVCTYPSNFISSASSDVCMFESVNNSAQSSDFTVRSFQSTIGFPDMNIVTPLQNRTSSQFQVSASCSRSATQSVYFTPDSKNNSEVETEIYKYKVGNNTISKESSKFTFLKNNNNEEYYKCLTECQIYHEIEKSNFPTSDFQEQPQMSVISLSSIKENSLSNTSVCNNISNIWSQPRDFPLPSLQRTSFSKHEFEHLDERPFVCEICNRTFKRVCDRNWHQIKHSNERPYSCDKCNKTFKRVWDLNNHQKYHSDERPFACEICYKKFKRSSDVKQHQYVHSDERPFQCVECNKSFKRKGQLEAHKILHTDERNFCCDQCYETFNNKSALYKHKKKHS